MHNTRYYKEKYEQLSKVSHKQMLEITVLQPHISKCEAIMAELKKISEGVYRQRNKIAYVVSFTITDTGLYIKKNIDFVLHLVLPDFKWKATIAECRICYKSIFTEKTYFILIPFLQYLITVTEV